MTSDGVTISGRPPFVTPDAASVNESPYLGKRDFIPGSGSVGGVDPVWTPQAGVPSTDASRLAVLADGRRRPAQGRAGSVEEPHLPGGRSDRYVAVPDDVEGGEPVAYRLPAGWGETRRPWHLRRLSSRITGHRGHRWCGRLATGADVSVRRAPDGPARARFANVQTCGQMWECAVCRTAELTERAARLVQTVAEHREWGGECYLLTLTMRRPNIGPSLEHCLWALLDSWDSFSDSAVWRGLRTSHAPMFVRALEVTDGARGWHTHLHVLVYWYRPLADAERDIWRMRLASRWARAVDTHAGEPWRPRLDSVGCDLTPCSAARYLAKLGLEIASATAKEGRGEKGERYSAWQLLERTAHADAATRARAVARWREYVETMHGRKVLQASDELHLALARTHVDEYVDVEVARMSGATYRRLSARPEWLEVIARCVDAARLERVGAELQAAGVRPILAIRAEQELRETAASREADWSQFMEEWSRAYVRA